MQPRKTMHSSGVVLQPDKGYDKPCSYSIGLDASITSFGVYCAPLGNADWFGFAVCSEAKEGSDTTRALEIADEVISHLNGLRHPISIVTFEDYGPINRTSGKIAVRAEICGILKHHFLRTLRVPVIMVPPNSLKQYATGKGNASKEAMLDAAAALGYYPETSDEADAFFAASVGRCIMQNVRTGVSFHRVNP